MSEESDDFFEYTRGKKIPPEGIPGFDFSDPESIVEFTKYVVCEWWDWDGGYSNSKVISGADPGIKEGGFFERVCA